MASLLNLAFITLWMVLGYFACLAIFNIVLGKKPRNWIPAVCVVVAFTAGFNWPSAPRQEPAEVVATQAQQPAATVPQRQPNPGAADVSARCLKAAVPTIAGAGFFDNIDAGATQLVDGSHVSRSAPLSLSGWAVDMSVKKPARAACLLVDGKIGHGIRVEYGLSRPDVAANLGSTGLTNVGYIIFIAPGSLTVGLHRLTAFGVGQQNQTFLLSGSSSIIVQ